jgi:carbon-monoxide dehydrogenase medium subunit
MIPASFDYARAGSLDEALAALAAKDGTKVIAGGHSLIPMLRFRLAQPPRLVDIGHLAELKGIAETKDGVRIGAATTYREVLDSRLLRERYPLIAELTEGIGDRQVRNAGTIGGGLAHADPAADMPAATLALDAGFALRSRKATRTVKARDFFKGMFTTAMAEDELLVDIVVPPLPAGAGTAYASFEQAASGYSLAGAAAVVARKGGKVTHCALAVTGVASAPFLAAAAATALVGTTADAAAVAKAAEAALDGVQVRADLHAGAAYRKHLAIVMARRALERAATRAG